MDERKEIVKIGSGNVFKDLGFFNPEERLVKVELAGKINLILQKRKLTQMAAAKILGIPQPKISALNKGIVSGFSVGKLIILLSKLDQNIDIVIHEKNDISAKKQKTNFNDGRHIRVVYA